MITPDEWFMSEIDRILDTYELFMATSDGVDEIVRIEVSPELYDIIKREAGYAKPEPDVVEFFVGKPLVINPLVNTYRVIMR